jgi:hypothetical protein
VGTAAGTTCHEPPTRRKPTAVLLGTVRCCAGQPAEAATVSKRHSSVQCGGCEPRTCHGEAGAGPQLQVNGLDLLLLRRAAAPSPASAPATATTSTTTASTAHDVVGTVFLHRWPLGR